MEHEVPEPPLMARSISNKEKGGPPERRASLEEPSPIATACLKIETTCAHCNTTDTLCL
jgi:hypothetical protein